MMALRCDICGGYYQGLDHITELELGAAGNKKIKVRPRIIFIDIGNYHNSVDTCPTCMERIAEFIKELGTN